MAALHHIRIAVDCLDLGRFDSCLNHLGLAKSYVRSLKTEVLGPKEWLNEEKGEADEANNR